MGIPWEIYRVRCGDYFFTPRLGTRIQNPSGNFSDTISIYKKHKFFLFVRWNSPKMKKDIFNLIFGKHAHLSPSWMLNISEFQLSSFFVHRKKFTKKLK